MSMRIWKIINERCRNDISELVNLCRHFGEMPGKRHTFFDLFLKGQNDRIGIR